jgi:hypothetical protein
MTTGGDDHAPPPPVYPPPGSYPPPSAEYPYDPYRGPKPPGTNGKSIAALITSGAGLLCCGVTSLVGIVLGVIAMRETRRTGQDGYGMALAGVIIGSVVTGLWLVYWIVIVGLYASGWSLV